MVTFETVWEIDSLKSRINLWSGWMICGSCDSSVHCYTCKRISNINMSYSVYLDTFVINIYYQTGVEYYIIGG